MANAVKKHGPQTAGEVRRLIAEKGFKWTVDARLRDSDQLPMYARGGKLDTNVKPDTDITGKFIDVLREKPPTNPFLRDRWVELKLLPPESRVPLGGSPPNVSTRPQGEKA